MRTENEIEQDILKLKEDFEFKKITKKDFLDKQAKLMQESLELPNLSIIKQNYIRNALKLIKITRRFL